MPASAKLYRIERQTRAEGVDPAAERHREIMAAIGRLSAEIGRAAPAAPSAGPSAAEEAAREMIALYKRELAEARKLKAELDAIQAAIMETKREIATLHRSNEAGGAMHRVTDELDAVVGGTEDATNIILAAAERVDERARDLAAKLTGDDQGMANDISDAVVQIFEACNFQDLTGQRIGKVVGVLRFVEQRVDAMMTIWGGLQAFDEVEPSVSVDRAGERALLNGPALPGEDRASQDMIDALFK